MESTPFPVHTLRLGARQSSSMTEEESAARKGITRKDASAHRHPVTRTLRHGLGVGRAAGRERSSSDISNGCARLLVPELPQYIAAVGQVMGVRRENLQGDGAVVTASAQ